MSTPDDELIWTCILDDYERILAEQERALSDSRTFDPAEVPSFQPPTVAVPLPDSLRSRAAALATRTSNLVAEATERMSRYEPRPAMSRPRPARPTTTSATFDQRA